MNLLTLRQSFIEAVGRPDLATTVTASYDTDAGADKFIQEGQNYLENELDLKEETNVISIVRALTSSAHDYYIDLDDNTLIYAIEDFHKQVKKVWLKDYDSTAEPQYITELEYKSWEWIIENYPDYLNEDVDEPIYWTFRPSQLAINDRDIILMPPIDQNYRVEFWGTGRTRKLSANIDTNLWGDKYPLVLLEAAKYCYFMFYSMDAKATSCKSRLDDLIRNVDNNTVEFEISNKEEAVI